jgi:AAA15 family ATPase/GTPase
MYSYFIILEDKNTFEKKVIKKLMAKRVRAVYDAIDFDVDFKKYNLIICKGVGRI